MTEPTEVDLTCTALLVLRVDQRRTADSMFEAARELSRSTGKPVVVLEHGYTLQALDEDDMRAAGWVRAEG